MQVLANDVACSPEFRLFETHEASCIDLIQCKLHWLRLIFDIPNLLRKHFVTLARELGMFQLQAKAVG